MIGDASNGLEALQKAEALKPDLILLDIGLPKPNGIEVEKRLRQLVPNAKGLFLTHNSDADVASAALSNGARGYMLKTDAGRHPSPAIEGILRG